MKTNLLTVTYVLGGILILVSSVLVMEGMTMGKYLFAVGAALYILTKFKQQYTGDDFRLKRLNRNNLINSFLLVGIAYLQFKTLTAWVVLLLMVALIEMYTSLRQASYEKEAEKVAAERKAARDTAKLDQDPVNPDAPADNDGRSVR